MAFVNIKKIILGQFEVLKIFEDVFFTPFRAFFGVRKAIINLPKHNH
jgi:hypothetical protein